LFKTAPDRRKLDIRTVLNERQRRLKEYKDQLDRLNENANQMFERMKDINKLVSKKTAEIETEI